MPGRVRITTHAVVQSLPSFVPKKRPATLPPTSAPPSKRQETPPTRQSSKLSLLQPVANQNAEVTSVSESTQKAETSTVPAPVRSTIDGQKTTNKSAADTQDVQEPLAAEQPNHIVKDDTPRPPVYSRNSRRPKNTDGSPQVYACDREGCLRTFNKPCRLEEHRRSHDNIRPFKCTFEGCGKAFLRDAHLRTHVQATHEKKKPYRCAFMIRIGSENEVGDFGFKRKKASTPEPEAAEQPLASDGLRECGAVFALNTHLKRHLESHKKTWPHMCTDYPPCKEGFRKRGPLQRHIREEHLGLDPFACTHMMRDDPKTPCTASFTTKGKLANHIVMQHQLASNRFICTICAQQADKAIPAQTSSEDSSTGNESDVQPGESNGNLDKNTSCAPVAAGPVGEREETSRELGLEKAVTTIAEVDTAQAAADTPGKNSSLVGLDTPMTDSDPFPIIQNSLVPVHLSEAVIAQGAMGFSSAAELRRHVGTAHPPVCETCGYVAKRTRDLNTHIRDKHGKSLEERRIFPCEFEGCAKRFTKNHALKLHFQTAHEGLRPYLCPHEGCDKKYAQNAWMQRHFQTKHTSLVLPSKKRGRRKKRTKPLSLIQALTGIGYEDTGRNIACIIEHCPVRFCRVVDLKVHLAATKGHRFTPKQAEEALAGFKANQLREDGDEDEDEDDSDDDSDFSTLSESEDDVTQKV